MFFEYSSASLKDLADFFARVLTKATGDPLSPAWIVVQNNEIREWLSLRVAAKNGITANTKYILPSEFLWQLYRLKDDQIPDSLPTDRHSMHWALYSIFSPDTSRLQAIPVQSETISKPKRLFQFCGQLADVLDQYLVYRPGMMENWLGGDISRLDSGEKWQAETWKQLNAFFNKSDAGIPRRSEAQAALISWIEQEEDFISALPNEIHVFGLSQKTKPFLDILTSLAHKVNVHFYSRTSDTSHSLFQKWSKPALDQQQLLETLLKEKRVDREKIRAGETHKPEPEVEIHSCHNIRREAEVLKECILRFLDKNKEANAEDILIMVPDAGSYSSTVQLIFENEEEEPGLPVSAMANHSDHEVSFAITTILRLLSSSYKANDVAGFISLPIVRDKFDLSKSDIDLVEEWIHENKVFRELGRSYADSYSWRKGVNQLLSGFAMETQAPETFYGLVPYGGVVTSDHALLAGKLSAILNRIKESERFVRENHTPGEWLIFTTGLIEDFLADGESYLDPVSGVKAKIKRFEEELSFIPDPEPVSFDIFRSWMTTQITGEQARSGRFGHGITLSTYVPYRSVPFKFIAMLGLNEGVFPRKKVRPAFDLIYSDPKPGERILKEDDTFLFLETLQAAEEKLHLSYIGQDQKTDSRKLPSILIRQLVDQISHEPTQHHKLHPFSSYYFQGEGRPGYSAYQAELHRLINGANKRIEAFTGEHLKFDRREENIEVNDLISFFSHPSKHFVLSKLDLNAYDQVIALQDRESFKLEGLDRYNLDRLLLDSLSHETDAEKVKTYAKAAHLLPEELAGEKAFEVEKKAIGEFIKAIEELTGTERESMEDVQVDLEGITLSGRIPGLFGNNFISFRTGQLKAKYLADHWISHLVLMKAGVHIKKSIYLYKKGDSIEKMELSTDLTDQKALNTYLNWYTDRNDLLDKLNFFPESSLAFAGEFIKSGDLQASLKKAGYKWEPSEYTYNAEGGDYFNRLVWRGRNPLNNETFRENALRFWKPCLKAQEDS